MWPTPTVDTAIERTKPYAQGGTSLSCAVKTWPTPRSRESGDYTYDQGDKTKPRLTLSGAVKRWPTPTVDDANQGKAGRQGGQFQSLTRAAKWPTPTARDRHNRGPSEEDRHSPSLGYVATGGDATVLNPDWVEWLMNWPVGWTSLKPLPRQAFETWLGNVAWWQNEPAVPRIKFIPNKSIRVSRIRAIGNGQVPLCTAVAWRLLTEDTNGTASKD